METVLHFFGFCGDNQTHLDLTDLFFHFGYISQNVNNYYILTKTLFTR